MAILAANSTPPAAAALAAAAAAASPQAILCGGSMSADVDAGGSLAAKFTVPATGVPTVTFSTRGTEADDILTVGGVDHDKYSTFEHVTIDCRRRAPGTTIPVSVRFFDASKIGVLQLGVKCATFQPTVSPTTTAPTSFGGTFAPTRCPDQLDRKPQPGDPGKLWTRQARVRQNVGTVLLRGQRAVGGAGQSSVQRRHSAH